MFPCQGKCPRFESAYPLTMTTTSLTTLKGNIGQTAVMLAALNRGYHVSIPLEGAAYDLVIDRNGKLSRVQVKYTTQKNGVVKAAVNDKTSDDIDAIIYLVKYFGLT